MRIAFMLAAFFILPCSVIAQSQTYKCTGTDGKVTLQQSACSTTPTAPRALPSKQSAIPSLTELIVRCSKLAKESIEYHTCAAQLSCVEAGSQGAVYSDCVEKLTEGRRRANAAAEAKADEEKTRQQRISTSQSRPVDCTSLYSYARAKGHGWIESVAIAKESEESGTCIRSK